MKHFLRRSQFPVFIVIGFLLSVTGCGSSTASLPGFTPTPATGRTASTPLALTPSPPTVTPVYPPNDTIPCDQGAQVVLHVHVHLSLYIYGKISVVPAGIGIAPDLSCLYWVHTHDISGIIHVEALKGATFILGNFLDLWKSGFASLGYPSQEEPRGRSPLSLDSALTGGAVPKRTHPSDSVLVRAARAPPRRNRPPFRNSGTSVDNR